jgi:hypothetical protein
MAMKDIAVFVDLTPDGDDWLRFAASIARTHNVRLTGVHVVGHSRPFPSYVRGHYAIQSLISNWFVSEQRCAVQKRKRFNNVVEQYKIQTNFRVVSGDTDTNRRIGGCCANLLGHGAERVNDEIISLPVAMRRRCRVVWPARLWPYSGLF